MYVSIVVVMGECGWCQGGWINGQDARRGAYEEGKRGGCGVEGKDGRWVPLAKELEDLYFFEGQWIRSFGLAD